MKETSVNQGCGSGSAWIRINLSCWIRIKKGENDPTNIEKVKNFHVVKCWMPRYNFLSKKYPFFSAVIFFQFLVFKTPDTELDQDPDPDPH